MDIKHNNIRAILDFSDRIINHIPKKESVTNALLAAYFLSLYEQVSEIEFLVSNNRLYSVPSLTRRFLETYVDFKLIAKNPNHVHSLILKADKEEIKKLKGLLENDNLSCDESKKMNDRKDFIEEEIEKRRTLIVNSIKNIEQKFEQLELSWLYKTFYNVLCNDTHNAITLIEKNHIQMSENSGVSLKLLVKSNIQDIKSCFSVIETCLIDSIKTLNDKLKLNLIIPDFS